jgi:hypothetical protein
MSNEDKKETWLSYLALTTVIFAVCATLATFKGGGYSTKSVISQAQASDQWAFYQAKAMKGYLYELQEENLEIEQATMSKKLSPEISDRYTKAIAHSQERVEKYEKDKSNIQSTAKALEHERDLAQQHSHPFGIAVIFLQVAILICSISGLFKRKILWQIAMPIGALGVIYFFNGFFLFF